MRNFPCKSSKNVAGTVSFMSSDNGQRHFWKSGIIWEMFGRAKWIITGWNAGAIHRFFLEELHEENPIEFIQKLLKELVIDFLE